VTIFAGDAKTADPADDVGVRVSGGQLALLPQDRTRPTPSTPAARRNSSA
jgi:hypothetical protein